MADKVFVRKTPEEIVALERIDIIKLQAEEIPNTARLNKRQLASFTKDEVIRLNSTLKNDFPKEKTDELVVFSLKEFLFQDGIIKDEFAGLTEQDICNKINEGRINELEQEISPAWYEIVGNIPGTENVCTVDFIKEALK